MFPEDTKEYIQKEIEDAQIKILGTCVCKLNTTKATLLINKSRNKSKLDDSEKHGFLMELSRESMSFFMRAVDVQESRTTHETLGTFHKVELFMG